MDTSTYPGKGLSPSQLAFALNQELRREAFSPFVALDLVSQLERDLIAALATAREWKNSFVPINRIPLDVLSLIPTHLTSHKDRFRASFVCRHWRRTFLQHGALWSQLFLSNGEEYVKTLLERTKGSKLEIITGQCQWAPRGTFPLLSSHTRRIKRLEFQFNNFTDVPASSGANPGPTGPIDILCDAVNLEEFVLDSKLASFLNPFAFPNLTTFKLLALWSDGIEASDLFDFLKGSPTLRTVEVQLSGGIILGETPQDMVTVLPNVETFSLFVWNPEPEYKLYEPIARISCPSAKYTSLTQDIYDDDDVTAGLEMFPDPIPWQEITRQYGSSPVEEVTLKMVRINIAHSLVFRTSDATVITLGCRFVGNCGQRTDPHIWREEMHLEIFSQACRTIQGHPLLSHVKRLHIEDDTGAWSAKNLIPAAKMAGDLFKSLGPLDELTIHGIDLQIFLAPFVGAPHFQLFERVFPPVKELTISGVSPAYTEDWMDIIVELAKSQHELGIPFERVTVRAKEIPADTTERLREWVSAVNCCEM